MSTTKKSKILSVDQRNIDKLSNKDLREYLGISQFDLAKQIGIGRATLQRFEYGTSKNKKAQEWYDNVRKNKDLVKEFVRRRDTALRKAKKLNQKGIEDSPAMRNLMSRGGVPNLATVGADRTKLKREIGKMKEFNNYQTTTIKGYKAWKENITAASMQTSGQYLDTSNEAFWRIFNELKGNTSYWKYWKNGRFDSDQAIADIERQFSLVDTTEYDSVEDIMSDFLDILSENSKTAYEEFMAGFEED